MMFPLSTQICIELFVFGFLRNIMFWKWERLRKTDSDPFSETIRSDRVSSSLIREVFVSVI